MSTETPEAQPKSIYQIRIQQLAAAISAWQEQAQEDGEGDTIIHPIADASALEDCLLDKGLLILPRAAVHGKWRVLVDGDAATYPGQDRPAGPVDAELAAEMFLIEAAKDNATEQQIVVRPASDVEMVTSAVIGDTTVRHDWIRITAQDYASSRENATGRVELKISGDGGAVVIDLGDDGDEILAGLLGFHERDEDVELFDDEDMETLVVLDKDHYTAHVTALINQFAKALAGSIREDYPIHLARLRGALIDLGDGSALADQAESEATGYEIQRMLTPADSYDWLELVAFAAKTENEGFHYAYDEYGPKFQADAVKAIAADRDRFKEFFESHSESIDEWWDTPDAEKQYDAHIDAQRAARQATQAESEAGR
jgi:hypothetical protein